MLWLCSEYICCRLERAHAALPAISTWKPFAVFLPRSGALLCGRNKGVAGSRSPTTLSSCRATSPARTRRGSRGSCSATSLKRERRVRWRGRGDRAPRSQLFSWRNVLRCRRFLRIGLVHTPLLRSPVRISSANSRGSRSEAPRSSCGASRKRSARLNFSKFLRQKQAAVRREAFRQGLGERLALRPAATTDVKPSANSASGSSSNSSRSLQLPPVESCLCYHRQLLDFAASRFVLFR